MTSILSPVPRFIFTVLEPLSTFGGFLAPLLNPASFVADQLPSDEVVPLTPNSHVLALQLGNVYGLLAMLGVAVLYTTTEPKVVRNYLIALWLADLSHIGFTAYFMGYDALLDVASWNHMAWGNIAFTGLLCVTRIAWFLGLFAPDNSPGKVRRGLPNKRT